MPKKSKYPRFRTHVKRGKSGQVWTSFWYDMRKEGKPDIPLGNDYQKALARWQEIHEKGDMIAGTLEEAFVKYEEKILPHHKDETRIGYRKQLARIRPVFGPERWGSVTLQDIVFYLEKRTAKVQANREISLLSIIWNKARLWGMTDLPWPAHGMQRSGFKNKESARDVYVSDAQFEAIYKHASQVLKDAMDIASATGLRVKDVCALRLMDFVDSRATGKASKTGQRFTYDIAESSVLAEILERRKKVKAPHVFVLDEKGQPVDWRMLNRRFGIARALAAKEYPAAGSLYLRDMRKKAAQATGNVAEAARLLQHSSTAITRRHYGASDVLKPVR